MNLKKFFLMGSLLASAGAAQAFQVVSVSPQGEVAQVRQVLVRFDEAAVSFGDPKAAAAATLSCSDSQASKGAGRWINAREWAFDFEADLAPGIACSLQLREGLKAASGAVLKSTGRYAFSTGGPFVRNTIPNAGERIDEDQFFILQLNGPATLSSVQNSVWCAADGLGERIPVRLIEGKDRAALLKAHELQKDAQESALSIVTLACNRRLTPAAKVQLVYDKGVFTPPGTGGSNKGVSNSVQQRFDFTVREPFEASFNCERENAQSNCLPIRPMRLSFNAPVPLKLAQGIRLKSEKDSYKPTFDKEDDDSQVSSVSFKLMLPELTKFTLELPRDFKDVSGRVPRNADSFPLTVATGAMPPLAKFAAAPFGIVERLAEPDGIALLPVTLRKVEAALQIKGLNAEPGKVSDLKPSLDADIIAWFSKVQRYDRYTVSREIAATDVKGPLPKVLNESDEQDNSEVQSRMLSLLQGQPGVTTLNLPQASSTDLRPFEVVGIPLSPGFHVIEIASQKLGASLLDERHGSKRTMVVRTSALVTNLAVHFKLGRDNALAWVTSLDRGLPVANAKVQVSDCRGKPVASASTNAQGIASLAGISPEAPTCQDEGSSVQAYFVSARATQSGVADMAFTWSDWHRGIEPWRFNVPTSREVLPDARAHTIFDRTLLRAGETVSMKHILRTETAQGFGLPTVKPTTLVVTHVGSGQEYTQSLLWRKTATAGISAESSFAIPPTAKLGAYQVQLRGAENEPSLSSGEFRVEEFRLPVLAGRLAVADKKALVNVKALALDLAVNYVSGGPARGLPVRVSALLRDKSLSYSDYADFSFQNPRGKQEASSESEEEASATPDARVIADKLSVTLDKTGSGKLSIDKIPATKQPQDLLLEATYSDPSGEVQTLRSVGTLWPAAVVAGIKTEIGRAHV